MMISRYYIED